MHGLPEANAQALVKELVERVLPNADIRLHESIERGQIDIAGHGIVIEVERTLELAAKVQEGESQLVRYMSDQAISRATEPVGLLTDGVVWRGYVLSEDGIDGGSGNLI